MTEITDRLTSALAGRYRLERHIGEGGMASVYLAHDVKHDRKVAIKILKAELSAILGGERFLQEIKVTANLQHPNILPLYDSGEADGFLYYVMPFFEGDTLRDKMDREKQMSVEETVQIAKSVAAALDYAHRHDVVHRDIKPENVLMQDGQAVVADFGIALAVSQAGGTRLTETGLSMGTPHYMAPEQATGDRELDARCDIYSLGAMTYEMLVGEAPHIGNSVQAIVAKILSERPSPITQTRDMVPAHVDAAVQRSLAKSPADRFTSAAKFAEALSDTSFTLPTTSGPTEASVPARESGISKRLFTGVSALAAILLVTTVLGWMRPDPPRPVSRYNVSLPLFAPVAVGVVGARLAITPDGNQLIYTGMAPDGNRLQLFMRDRHSLDGRPLPGTEDGFAPTLSPDGGKVAFLGGLANTTMSVASLAGGPPVVVSDSGTDLQGLSWGPDDYLYAAAQGASRTGTGLVRTRAAGGSALEPVSAIDSTRNETDHVWPVALPNGRGVLFQIQHGTNLAQSDIAVVDLATGTHEYLARGVYAQYAVSGHLVYVTADGTLMVVPFDQDKLELTGEPTALAEGLAVRFAGAADLTVSHGGTLVYTRGEASSIVEPVWVTREGAASFIDPDWSGEFGFPELSPDGRRLAISQTEDNVTHLWVKQLDRGPNTKLTHEGTVNFRPTWTPDGAAIAYISDRGENNDLLLRYADGSAREERLLGAVDTDLAIWEARLSEDGEWIVYRGETTSSDIFALRLGGDTDPIPLVATEATERMPVLSPDGRWLAYISNMSGDNEVYVRPFPNANDAMWQISTAGGVEPQWAHSGRELFYRNGRNEMVAVQIDPGPSFQTGGQQVLFSIDGFLTANNRHQYDVAPDDQRFVMLRTSGDANPTEIIVVENWFEELKGVGN